MPVYEFQCKQCSQRFERMLRMTDEHPTDCPNCGTKDSVVQLISAPAVQFKGSGWYVTDYAKKSPTASAKGDGKGETKTESKPEVKASESKSESKSEAKSESKSSDKK